MTLRLLITQKHFVIVSRQFPKPLQGRNFRERAYQCQLSIMLIIVLVNADEQMSL